MNCEDARLWLSTRRSGRIALTEWALVEVHLKQCARCREEDARLLQQRPDAPPATSAGAALTGSTIRAAQGGSLQAAVVTEAARRVMAAVMQAVSLGVGYWASLRSRLRALRAIAVEFLMRHAARRSTAPGPHDCSPASALEPAQPQPTLPNDRRGFARPSPRADIVPAPREASAPAASAGSASHVVGRLSVKARIAAERDLSALLGEVEATEVGRMHRPAFTAIEAVVPHGRYRDLTDGLARIGFWRLEATCFSLPDAVRITIRVSE